MVRAMVRVQVRVQAGGGNQSDRPSLGPIENQTVVEGRQLIVDPEGFDPNNDALSYELVTENLPGTAAVNAQTGQFTWTTPSDAGGNTFLITIKVTDATGLTDTGTFNVSVTNA